jgi:hypothetical protein
MRAVAAVFTPQEQTRRERLKQVEKLANEIGRHFREGMAPRCVILLAGGRLVFAMPKTAKCQRLLGLRSAMLVGTYGGATDPERIKQDLEATLTEYHEGVPTRALPEAKP